MTKYNKYGFAYDQVIAENEALPNDTNATLPNTVTLDAVDSNDLRVIICAASTAVAIADGETISFTPLFGNTAAAGGCLTRALGTTTFTGGDITLKDPGNVTTVDVPNPLTFPIGTVIYEFLIPARLCSAYKYMKINVACSEDQSGAYVEAFVLAD